MNESTLEQIIKLVESANEKEATEELLATIKKAITQAYHLEALRSGAEDDNDAGSARLITSLKTCRGILHMRLREMEKA